MRLQATIRVRNDHMIAARKRLGFSQKALAEVAGVSIYTVHALEQLDYTSPQNINELSQRATLVAGVLEIPTDQVLPPEYIGKAIATTHQVVRDIPLENLLAFGERLALPSGTNEQERFEMREDIEPALASLSFRERAVLALRYGLDGEQPHTLQETGEKIHVTRGRVKQIEMKAIRKIENHNTANSLREYVTIEEQTP